ncbi:IS66 family insertion sequence element accessory protein TnpA [Alicyclobacillus sendaiensis]|uniref:IS66 family insertion sequence element accessory protein TnpB n=1 Tax=Alicyclobacillus sendaiensis PA2 TaxID=3029425 RepID=A0ABT6Y1E6_ALISE|nr:IS66 family insertion sequence element accessory protein TnpB [Alicyclobacillus sendaiensis]MDI9261175.1 IS66 family insertion sequence element accessory protein TnpB [Alicyclobacillus sendaiensis PA2]
MHVPVPHHEKRQLWRERVAAFYDSGLTAAEFCAQQGLKPHQLWYWVRRFREATHGSQPAFVSVVTEEPSVSAAPSPITLRVGKVEIEVRPGYDATTLGEFVRLVMASC